MADSNCCGAYIYDDTDICSACKEHCEEQEEEVCCASYENGFLCTCIKTGYSYSQAAEDDGYADYVNDMRRDFEEDV